MAKKYNYYEILGLKSDATIAEIKSAFRKLAKQFHPDKYFHPSQKIWATRRFQNLVGAYETLSDPQKRKEYDETFLVINIPAEASYHVSKDIYYYWWLRVYLYFLPFILSHLIYLLTDPVYSPTSILEYVRFIILYGAFYLFLPWILLGLFPPFWCSLSSNKTKNMGCIISLIMWGGLSLGISTVMYLLFNLKAYPEYVGRILMPTYFIILFYVISFIVFSLLTWDYVKNTFFLYSMFFFGLIFVAICGIRAFMKGDWTYFLIFCFYSAICIDSLVSEISYEYFRKKLKKIVVDLDLQQLLIEE